MLSPVNPFKYSTTCSAMQQGHGNCSIAAPQRASARLFKDAQAFEPYIKCTLKDLHVVTCKFLTICRSMDNIATAVIPLQPFWSKGQGEASKDAVKGVSGASERDHDNQLTFSGLPLPVIHLCCSKQTSRSRPRA